MKQWINFVELRKRLPLETVLTAYDVRLTQKGKTSQHVGPCPLPSHGDRKGNPFSANFEKHVWQCFGCKQGGNVIDFAVLMEGKDKKNGADVRAVATSLWDRFVERRTAPDSAPSPANEPVREDRSSEPSVIVNQPLDFELKTLDPNHPYFTEKKLTAETVVRFGLGFCKRGSLAGRIAVPLVDDSAQLVGYAGLTLDDERPRYLFPAQREHEGVKHVFDPGRFVYNGFRIGKSVKDLIVVRECHTVWDLWQGGFANVVALMQTTCSEDQATSMCFLTADTARIWFVTDSTRESESCATNLLVKVAPKRLCRWLKVKHEEEMAPDHPLLAALPKR